MLSAITRRSMAFVSDEQHKVTEDKLCHLFLHSRKSQLNLLTMARSDRVSASTQSSDEQSTEAHGPDSRQKSCWALRLMQERAANLRLLAEGVGTLVCLILKTDENQFRMNRNKKAVI